jgi:hypothetical protein
MSILRNAVGFGSAALFTIALTTENAAEAGAKYRVQNAQTCQALEGTQAGTGPGQGQIYGTGQGGGEVDYACSVLHDSYLPLNETAADGGAGGRTLTVSGYAPIHTLCTSPCGDGLGDFGSVCLQACRIYNNGSGAGGACGALDIEGSTQGVFHAEPDLSTWRGGAQDDSYEVYARLAGSCSSTLPLVYGLIVK